MDMNDKEEFSFVFASDLHYEVSVNPDIPEANARTFCLLNDINDTAPDLSFWAETLRNEVQRK